jgi:hypothetical protein
MSIGTFSVVFGIMPVFHSVRNYDLEFWGILLNARLVPILGLCEFAHSIKESANHSPEYFGLAPLILWPAPISAH